MSEPNCQPARDEIAPFQVGYPAAAARRYASALANRAGLAERLARNDRLIDEARRGADVVMRETALAGLVAQVSGAGGSHPLRGAPRKSAWTAADDRLIRDHYAKRDAVWCSRRIGRTISACRVRAGKLGVAKSAKQPDTSPWRAWRPETHKKPRAGKSEKSGGARKAWTESDFQYLKDNYVARGAAECSAALGRSVQAVRLTAMKLGLRILAPAWSLAENRVVKACASKGVKGIDAALKKLPGTPPRTAAAIRHQAEKLGLNIAVLNVRWSKREDQLVRRHYGAVSMKKMIALLGGKRTQQAIVFRAYELRRRAR